MCGSYLCSTRLRQAQPEVTLLSVPFAPGLHPELVEGSTHIQYRHLLCELEGCVALAAWRHASSHDAMG